MRLFHVLTLVLAFLLVIPVMPSHALAQEPVLRLTQRLTIVRDGKTINTQRRTYYVHKDRLYIKSRAGSILIRPDLHSTWLLTDTRQPIAVLTTDEIRALLNPLAKSQPTLPGFAPTKQTKTIAGIGCAVHQGALGPMTVNACLTQAFPQFAPFHQMLGMQPLGAPSAAQGFPMELIITIQPPNDDRPTVVTQLVETIERVPLEPTMFDPPQDQPLLQPGSLAPRDNTSHK
jgi:hypothetical protein